MKDTNPLGLDLQEAPLALHTLVAVSRLQSLHQSHSRSKRQGHLLVSATYTKDGAGSISYHFEYAGQGFWRVQVPWMALAAENNVRRRKIFETFQRNAMERFQNDLKVGSNELNCLLQFPRARSLAIDGVVNEVNQIKNQQRLVFTWSVGWSWVLGFWFLV